jgi:RNA polymerase sigma-70 factor (ECF subfamily)
MFAAEYETVVRYVRRRSRRDDLDDIVAETFLVAWRRFDEVPTPSRAWLLGVARNVMRNAHRSGRRQVALASRAADNVPRPAPSAQDSAVGSAFAALAPQDRELLALIAWEGLAPHEAAVVLGCSPVALRVRLHRARRRLETLMSAETPAPAMTPAKEES